MLSKQTLGCCLVCDVIPVMLLYGYSYSSPVDAQALPISNFSYQEPENDPRSFCYLWVARCSGVCSASDLSDSMMEYIAGTTASISLYQLAYDMKSYTDDGNVLFKVSNKFYIITIFRGEKKKEFTQLYQLYYYIKVPSHINGSMRSLIFNCIHISIILGSDAGRMRTRTSACTGGGCHY